MDEMVPVVERFWRLSKKSNNRERGDFV